MLEQLRKSVRNTHGRRWILVIAGLIAPWAAISLALDNGASLVLALVAGAMLALTGIALIHARTAGGRWVGLINHQVPELEYSASLLGRSDANWLERRQKSRVQTRLEQLRQDGSLPQMLMPHWWPETGHVALAGLALAALAWMTIQWSTPLLGWTVTVSPPAYTGIEPWQQRAGDIVAPEGSRIRWEFTGSRADQARVVIDDAQNRQPDPESGEDAVSEEPVFEALATHSLLYQITSGEDVERFALEVIADQPPKLAISRPDQPVTEFQPVQTPLMDIAVIASDDYALSELTALVTLARGDGESVRFRDLSVPIALDEPPLASPLSPADSEFMLTLTAEQFELEPGDELYVRIVASDNREPPQSTRSSALIFRWLRDDAPTEGTLAAIAVDRMPAYFRSQRQIIIDTEALLAEAAGLDQPEFLRRSQIIGADQRTLRMRYGQYLGEEESTEIGASAMPDHDEAPGVGHDGEVNLTGFGAAAETDVPEILEPYVHAHDSFLEATIFDEHTRDTLVAALSAMWRAELQLGLGQPAEALPHENEALLNLKLVQQAARIYVKRVGFEPPPLDEARRLTGELDEASGTSVTHHTERPSMTPGATLIPALLAGSLAADHRATLLAMMDDESLPLELRRDMARVVDHDCRSCAESVAEYLWDNLPTPSPGPIRRQAEPSFSGPASE